MSRSRNRWRLRPACIGAAPAGHPDPDHPGLRALGRRRRRIRDWLRVHPAFSQTLPAVIERRATLAALGDLVRPAPYPFTAALAVTSDIDCCNRQRQQTYLKALVYERGLDFGDSFWLHTSRSAARPGIGFFGPSLRYDPETARARRSVEPDPYGIASDFHRGNLDHWHGLLPHGPRVIPLRDSTNPPSSAQRVVFPVPPQGDDPGGRHATWFFPVTAITVILSGNEGPLPVRVRLCSKLPCDGAAGRPVLDCFETPVEIDAAPSPCRQVFFAATYPPDDPRRPLMVEEIDRVEVELPGPRPTDGIAVLLHDCHSGLLIDRLHHLEQAFGIRTNCLTVHGSFHFLWHHVRRQIAEGLKGMLAHPDGTLKAFTGSVRLGHIRFSSYGDDPRSFACVGPELRRRFGIRFIRICGQTTPELFDLRREAFSDLPSLVYPTRSGDGGTFYLMRATISRVPDDNGAIVGHRRLHSSASTFCTRIDQILRDFRHPDFRRNLPPRGIVFYTHLGDWDAPVDSGEQPPYLDQRVMDDLLATIHRGDDCGIRLWFTRASVLCDYASLLDLLPALTTRSADGTVISVRRFDDPLLEERVPRSAEHLYGQTFYVSDSRCARLYLEDEEVHDLQRNPADLRQPGWQSVTVAACGIRQVLFDELDPLSTYPVVAPPSGRTLEWRWVVDADPSAPSRAFGLAILPEGAETEPAGLSFDVGGTGLEAAQYVFFDVWRSEGGTAAGLLLETVTGGRFYFGDGALRPTCGALTAWYERPEAMAAAAPCWRRVVVPLADLVWTDGQAPPHALPCHRLERCTLLAAGPAGAQVGFDRVELGRPRTTPPVGGAGRSLVGGRVCEDRAGIPVRLTPICSGQQARSYATVSDGFGGFRFPPIEHGAWRLDCDGGDGRTRRRPFEIRSDRFDLEI